MALRVTSEEYVSLQTKLGVDRSEALLDQVVKPPKYRNAKTVIDGITFDSKGEAARYCELKLMERAGVISGLLRQQKYSLDVRDVHICSYVADFVYWEKGELVVEDWKGYVLPEYRLKKKLMLACYNIEIRETGKRLRRRK